MPSAGGTDVRIGVAVLPEYPGSEGLGIWRDVEDMGADHAWTFDHLAWRSVRDRPWFDSMTTLAAVAGVTRRMTLGTLVVSPDFRHPVTTAQQVMTVDHLSGGRFVLGIGAGAGGTDSTALGGTAPDRAQRSARFGEFVTLTAQLLCGGPTTFTGQHFSAVDTRMVPGCVQRPRVPMAIAGTGPRGMRLAVEHGEIWVTNGAVAAPGQQTDEEAFGMLRDQMDRFTAVCRAAGRDPYALRRLVHISRVLPDPYGSADRFADIVGRVGKLGFTDLVVNYPRREGTYAGDPAAFERALTALTGTTAAGRRHDAHA